MESIEKIHASRMLSILQIQSVLDSDFDALMRASECLNVAPKKLNDNVDADIAILYRNGRGSIKQTISLLNRNIKNSVSFFGSKNNLKHSPNNALEMIHSSRMFCISKILSILTQDRKMMESFSKNEMLEFDAYFNGEMFIHYGEQFAPIIELLSENIKIPNNFENQQNLSIFSPMLKSKIIQCPKNTKQMKEISNFFNMKGKNVNFKKTNEILNFEHTIEYEAIEKTTNSVSATFGIFQVKGDFLKKYGIVDDVEQYKLDEFGILGVIQHSFSEQSNNEHNQYIELIDDSKYEENFCCIETSMSKKNWNKNSGPKPKNHNIVKGEFCRKYDDYMNLWKEFVTFVKDNFENINISKCLIGENFNIKVDKSKNFPLQHMVCGNGVKFFLEQPKTNKIKIPINMIDDMSDFGTLDITKSESRELKLFKIFNCLSISNDIIKKICENFYDRNATEETFDNVEFLKYLLKSKLYNLFSANFTAYHTYYNGAKMFFNDFGTKSITKALSKSISVEYNMEMCVLAFALQFFKIKCKISSITNIYYDLSLLSSDNLLILDKSVELIAGALLYCEVWNENIKRYDENNLKRMIQLSLMGYSPVKFRTLRLAMNIIGAPEKLIDCFNDIQEYNGFSGGWMDILLFTKCETDSLQYAVEDSMLLFEETIREQFLPYTINKTIHFQKTSDEVIYDETNLEVGEFFNLNFTTMEKAMKDINSICSKYVDINVGDFDKFGYDSKLFQNCFSGYSVYHSLVAGSMYSLEYVK